jgi:hypothetical protein
MSARAIRKIFMAISLFGAAAASTAALAQVEDCTAWAWTGDSYRCVECWRTVYSDRSWRDVNACAVPIRTPRSHYGYGR